MDGFSSAKKKIMAGIFFAVFIGILFFTFWPIRIKEAENKNISKIRERDLVLKIKMETFQNSVFPLFDLNNFFTNLFMVVDPSNFIITKKGFQWRLYITPENLR